MNRRCFIKNSAGFALSALFAGCTKQNRIDKPNIIIIFTDDQGYADVGVYGAKGFQTPHLDRMADEGMRFTDFYVAASVCTPSRAALMTGCYPQRIGLPRVVNNRSTIGLHPEEQTIAEVLKSRGYATACYGKWHLGHHPQFLPLQHGFDDYFGLPYSNDMWPHHPVVGHRFPPLPLIEGEQVIEKNPDQSQLTRRYTERAVQFIKRNKDQPFFLYLPHTMPHVPLFASEKFKEKSQKGIYGDVMMEIDWSVGQILKTLKQLEIDEKTLVLFTSDNGPSLTFGEHGGSALPLREGKGTSFEGGQRVPFLVRWPGVVPAGSVCNEMATTMDILPTVAKLTRADLPKRPIDGKDIWPLMTAKPNARTPHEAIYFYRVWALEAVRSGKWKLHFPHPYRDVIEPGKKGRYGKVERNEIGLALYDLENDIGEARNVADQYPEVVRRLQQYADRIRQDIGDSNRDLKGTHRRAPGQL